MILLQPQQNPVINSEMASMPTISESLKHSSAANLENDPFACFLIMLGAGIICAQNLPASPGYEPLLIAKNLNQISARGIAHTAVRHGKRMARDSQWMKPAADAIRFLGKPGRHNIAAIARAKVILEISENTSVIETLFENAHLCEFEFLKLLKGAAEGNKDGLKRISEIAAAVSTTLSLRRGPKISAASAAHEFFVEQTQERIELRAYTYDDIVGDFTDPLTEATRREFNDSSFNPKPAHRRIKARNGDKTRG